MDNLDNDEPLLIRDSLLRSLENITSIDNLFRANKDALRKSILLHDLYKSLIKDYEMSESRLETLNDLKDAADLCKIEVDKDFAQLNIQHTVMLYAYLEATIKRFVIAVFKTIDTSKIKEVCSIKIPLIEFQKLDDDEQFDYLFSQYEKEITVGSLYSINRFEKLLTPIGFSGVVDKNASKWIFELSQQRNNILHRGGVADRHLITNCPWLKYKINQEITVTTKQLEQYSGAIIYYITVITGRYIKTMHNQNEEYEKTLNTLINKLEVDLSN